MKNIKLILCSILISGICSFSFSQEYNFEEREKTKKERKVRPVRIGAKIGFPNLVGGSLEYVTPLLNNKLSVYGDFSTIKSDWVELEEAGDSYNSNGEQNSYDFQYIEGGINYYLFKPGRGLYAGVSYGAINIKGTEYGLASMDGNDNSGKRGVGTIDMNHNSFNIKLGAKLGGLFYFRPEVGYSFSSLPQHVTTNVVFDDGSSEVQTLSFDVEDGPAEILYKGLIANIGIGFAF